MAGQSVFAVTAAASACAGVFGAVAAWTTRRQDRREADQIVEQLLANQALGDPLAQLPTDIPAGTPTPAGVRSPATSSTPAGAGRGGGRPACRGRLTVHRDGSLSCHGGREDCWPGVAPDRYRHRRRISCRDLDHGCGVCTPTTTASAAGVSVPAPVPVASAGDGAGVCARGCGRPGQVWVAASGSLPTLVCAGCAGAIAAGRTWRVGDDRPARGEHAPGVGGGAR